MFVLRTYLEFYFSYNALFDAICLLGVRSHRKCFIVSVNLRLVLSTLYLSTLNNVSFRSNNIYPKQVFHCSNTKKQGPKTIVLNTATT